MPVEVRPVKGVSPNATATKSTGVYSAHTECSAKPPLTETRGSPPPENSQATVNHAKDGARDYPQNTTTFHKRNKQHLGHVTVVWNDHSGLALDGLHHKGHDVGVTRQPLFQRSHVVVRNLK